MTDSAFPLLKLLGLFEIDERGKILYSRSDSETKSPLGDMPGLNVFELVSPDTRMTMEAKINRFVSSNEQADSFYITHRHSDGEQRVKVLLGRIRHRNGGNASNSVLVHLRQI